MKNINNEQLIESINKIEPLNFTINVATTYEFEQQEMYDLEIKDIYPSKTCSMTTELDVLSQVVDDMKRHSENDLDYLVKISLCYLTDAISIDGQLQDSGDTLEDSEQLLEKLDLFEAITRSNSNYYFQPNQRKFVENSLVDKFDIAKLTSEF